VLLVLALAAGVSAAFASTQSLSISISSIADVTGAGDETAQNETPIAVDPQTTQRLVIGSNDWNPNLGCGVNFSSDGGATWTPTLPDGFVPGLTRFTNDPDTPGTGAYDVGGDPSVAFDPQNGKTYYSCLAYNLAPPFQGVIYLSTKAADSNTWQHFVISKFKGNGVTKGSNGQLVDHDNLHVAANGDIYVTWAEFNGSTRAAVVVAVSRDGGSTWKLSKVTSRTLRVNEDQRVVTDASNNAYLVLDNALQGNKGFGLYVSKSTDRGDTWSTPVQFATVDQLCMFPPDCFNIAGDGFRTGGSYPAPAFDDTRNRLDVAVADLHNGYSQIDFYSLNPTTFAVTHTTVTSGNADRFESELGVSPDGRVDLFYYDRSYSSNALVDVTYAVSTDGGQTWLEQRVTPNAYQFDPAEFGVPGDVDPRPFIGDYNGIVSTNDAAYMAWTGVGPDADPGTNPFNLEIELATATFP
jgi:hypothetical protein